MHETYDESLNRRRQARDQEEERMNSILNRLHELEQLEERIAALEQRIK